MRKVALAALIGLLAGCAVLVIRTATGRQALAVGAALGGIGLPLLVVGRLQLGRAFSMAPKATALVTRGLYSRIPHPMYAFLDVALLGVVIAIGREWLVAAWLGLVAAHVWAARREARVLEAAFGQAYRDYRARTWW